MAGSISAGLGEFFNGTRQNLTLAPTVRVGRAVQTSVSYSYNRINLPQDSFATHLVNSGFSYSFNNRWLTSTLVQYSDTSGLLTVFAQLDFIYPGSSPENVPPPDRSARPVRRWRGSSDR
ncbi:MAG: hypothetical protein HYU37_22515 [Acidobacteria bacterium]|nr:hypothetical protein [Acidobacteriota bacterium]